MYELVQVAEHTYYIQSPAKMGLYRRSETEVCLIDSGNDKDAGRKVRQILDREGWKLHSILVTHSNADHIGGCHYLQKQTGCKVFVPGIEADFTRHPILEPAFLYGGYPPRDLRHKFLMAEACAVSPMDDPDFPAELTPIALPGHFFDMVGYRTPDDVVFLADCLSSRETLEKYQIGFIYDVAAYLDTLEQVKTMEARMFVPAHTEATEHIAALAQVNIDKVREIGERIVALCAAPTGFEALLKELFDAYGLTMSFEQYALVGSTVRSYLAWLRDAGRVDVVFADNRLLWKTTE